MNRPPKNERWRNVLRHWIKFSAVGTIGIGIQLTLLAALRSGLEMNYLIATFLAVETTILHNFAWHERWTWRETTRESPGLLFVRLLRFNFTTGAISLFGNLIFMWLLVSGAHVHYFIANLLSIGGCALANFAVSHWFVFRRASS